MVTKINQLSFPTVFAHTKVNLIQKVESNILCVERSGEAIIKRSEGNLNQLYVVNWFLQNIRKIRLCSLLLMMFL